MRIVLKEKHSLSQIEKEIGVNKDTISRELSRNSKKRVYRAHYAQTISDERRKEAYKHSVLDINMKHYIDKALMQKQWSTEQIKGRCDLNNISMVSVERIYQYIYGDQKKGGELYIHLRAACRWRRKRLNRKHQRGQIPNRVMVGERLEIVQTKACFGDWEADTTIGKKTIKRLFLQQLSVKSSLNLWLKLMEAKPVLLKKR